MNVEPRTGISLARVLAFAATILFILAGIGYFPAGVAWGLACLAAAFVV